MARTTEQLALDDDPDVELTLRIPFSLYRAMHSYCVFRNAEADKIPLAVAGAMRAYLADNRAFQQWLREHPDVPVPPLPNVVRRRRDVSKARAGEHEAPT